MRLLIRSLLKVDTVCWDAWGISLPLHLRGEVYEDWVDEADLEGEREEEACDFVSSGWGYELSFDGVDSQVFVNLVADEI